jgi:hypothetical protein
MEGRALLNTCGSVNIDEVRNVGIEYQRINDCAQDGAALSSAILGGGVVDSSLVTLKAFVFHCVEVPNAGIAEVERAVAADWLRLSCVGSIGGCLREVVKVASTGIASPNLISLLREVYSGRPPDWASPINGVTLRLSEALGLSFCLLLFRILMQVKPGSTLEAVEVGESSRESALSTFSDARPFALSASVVIADVRSEALVTAHNAGLHSEVVDVHVEAG